MAKKPTMSEIDGVAYRRANYGRLFCLQRMGCAAQLYSY